MLGQDTLSERCERKVKVILKRQKDRQCLSRFMQEAEPNHHSSSCHPFRPGEWIEMSTITQPIYTSEEEAQRENHGNELGALKRRSRERYDAARKARDSHRRQRANRGFLKEALQNNEALKKVVAMISSQNEAPKLSRAGSSAALRQEREAQFYEEQKKKQFYQDLTEAKQASLAFDQLYATGVFPSTDARAWRRGEEQQQLFQIRLFDPPADEL